MPKTEDKPSARISDDQAFVASPSGPVPLGAVATGDAAEDRAAAEMDRIDAERKGRRTAEDLTDDELERLNAGEARAVAAQLGIDVPLAGRRAAIRAIQDSRKTTSKKKD